MTASDLNDCSSVATVSPTAAPTADPSTAAPSATPTATPSLPTFSPTSVGVEMAADPSTKKPSATATPTYVLDPTADFGYAMSDSFSDTDLDLSQSDFSDTDIDDLSESDRLAYDLAEGFSRRRLLQAAECEQNATALLAERLANVQKLTVRGDDQKNPLPCMLAPLNKHAYVVSPDELPERLRVADVLNAGADILKRDGISFESDISHERLGRCPAPQRLLGCVSGTSPPQPLCHVCISSPLRPCSKTRCDVVDMNQHRARKKPCCRNAF